MVLGILFSSASTEARILNLNGSLTLDYRLSRSETEDSESETRSFSQRYSLGAGGKIFRFGQYSLRGSWFNDKVNTESRRTAAATVEQQSELTIQDYQIFSNLFARSSPLSLSAQRIIRKNELGASSKDQIDVFNANWALNFRGYPRTVLSYTRSSLDNKSGSGGSGDFDNQAFSIQGEGEIERTFISMGYQWAESRASRGGPSQSHGLNFNLSSHLSAALTLAANARWSSAQIPPSVVVPGTTIFQERGAGVSLVYRPLLTWWDARAAYAYSESPFVRDFKSHNLSGSVNLRPHPKVNASAGARLTRIDLADTALTTESLSSSATYRPTFGLSTSLGAGFFHTLTSGNDDFHTYSHNYTYSLNYFKNFRNLQARSGYGLGFAQTRTSPDGSSSNNLNNSISLGLDNTNTRIVHVGSTVTATDNRNYTDGSDQKSSTLSAGINADSNYFKNIMRRGDQIGLRAGANYSYSRGLGLEGGRKDASASATYSWINLVAVLSYLIQDMPNEAQLDRQRFEGTVNWNIMYLRPMVVRLRVKDSFDDNRYRADTNRFETAVDLGYQIGLMSLTAGYQRIITSIIAEDSTSRSTVDVISGTLTRPF